MNFKINNGRYIHVYVYTVWRIKFESLSYLNTQAKYTLAHTTLPLGQCFSCVQLAKPQDTVGEEVRQSCN